MPQAELDAIYLLEIGRVRREGDGGCVDVQGVERQEKSRDHHRHCGRAMLGATDAGVAVEAKKVQGRFPDINIMALTEYRVILYSDPGTRPESFLATNTQATLGNICAAPLRKVLKSGHSSADGCFPEELRVCCAPLPVTLPGSRSFERTLSVLAPPRVAGRTSALPSQFREQQLRTNS